MMLASRLATAGGWGSCQQPLGLIPVALPLGSAGVGLGYQSFGPSRQLPMQSSGQAVGGNTPTGEGARS